MIALILLKLFTFSQILQGVPKLLHATVYIHVCVCVCVCEGGGGVEASGPPECPHRQIWPPLDTPALRLTYSY